MEKDGLFDFEFDKDEKCWIVTGYYGRSEEVILPAFHGKKAVKKIGDAFSPDNKRIKRVTIPEGYTSIGESAFSGCTGLTDITFPQSLTSIENGAFSHCTWLTEIEFPENLTSIGEWSFSGCTGLTKIKIPKNFPATSSNAWAFIAWAFTDCMKLAEIIVDENNPVFRSLDGVMFDKAMTTLIWLPAGKKGKYSVPDGIIRIRFFAFDNCRELTGISFPQSLLIIETDEFNCEQLTDIETDEFNCKQLTDITVRDPNPEFYTIDGVLFKTATSTLLKYPRNKDKTDYAVPDGTKYISARAFYGCKNLINIALPEGLEIIDNNVFAKCEGIKAITLPMSLYYIGERVFENCPNLKTITLSRKTRIGYKAFMGFKGQFVYRD